MLELLELRDLDLVKRFKQEVILKKNTLKALGLSKEEGEIAIEGLKNDIGLPLIFMVRLWVMGI